MNTENAYKRNMRRGIAAGLILLLVCFAMVFTGCGKKSDDGSPEKTTTAAAQSTAESKAAETGEESSSAETGAPVAGVQEGGTYDSKEDVAEYIVAFGRLPDNYITKKEARALGWSGGSVEKYAPGMCIGGDRFGNYEGLLPKGKYTECDIGTLGKDSRGAKRLVFSVDEIYYTDNHYRSFEKVCDR